MPPTLLDQYRRWFEYEKDAHRQVLASLETVPPEGRGSEGYRKALDLMGHLLAARRMWLHRIEPSHERPAAIFPTGVALEGLPDGFAAMERDWDAAFARLTDADLDRTYTYRTSEGDEYASVLADILTQLHGHSLYHRGQIASLVRACGGQPAATDFIYWSRRPADGPRA